MDSSQSPLNDQCHNDDIVALVPRRMAVKARPGGPTRDPNDQSVSTISPQLIDVTAEETVPCRANVRTRWSTAISLRH